MIENGFPDDTMANCLVLITLVEDLDAKSIELNVLELFEEEIEIDENRLVDEFDYQSVDSEGGFPILEEPVMIQEESKNGFVLVRYLGVPLITKQLSSTNCESLVSKITARIDSWLV